MEEDIFKIVEDLQEALVFKGGRFLKQTEVKDMRVGNLLELIVANGIGLVVEY